MLMLLERKGMMAEKLLLDGLKVLDVASWIAAPVAATMLADLGADVIKIELPGIGDGYRQFGLLPVTPTSDENYTWQMDARNRRSLALNLRSDEGRQILQGMIEECDVYITNQPLPLRRELKLNYEDLVSVNPRMIYASLTAYGEEGPDRDYEGFDLVAYWARSGLMDLVRERGAPPTPALPGMGDHPTAVSLYASIMTALLRRERTGEGAHVHTSLLHNGIWSASCIAQAKFSEADFSPYRAPERGSYPHTAFETADGRWLTLTMLRMEGDFDTLMLLLDATELLVDERFLSTEARLMNAGAFVDALRPYFARQQSDEFLARAAEAGLNVVRVGTLDELPDDPQVKLNPMLLEAEPEVTRYPVIDNPVHVDGLGRAAVTRPPDIGEHTEEILKERGYDAAAIERLREDGVI